MRLLFIGDIVGKPGRRIVKQALPGYIEAEQLDLVIANAENSAGGSGLTPTHYRELIEAGVDGITLGDHVYRRREIYSVLKSESNIVRPANLPAAAVGRRWTTLTSRSGLQVAMACFLGQLFMRPMDSPWQAAEEVLAEIPDDIKIRFVDFHAEATSEMQVMGRHLAGRVSAVLGTHTHVATADESILPGGTAFQCDVGMTGPHESIIGRRIDRVMEATLTTLPSPFDVATGDVRLNGAIVDIDPETGQATAIQRICIDQTQADQLAEKTNAEKTAKKKTAEKSS